MPPLHRWTRFPIACLLISLVACSSAATRTAINEEAGPSSEIDRSEILWDTWGVPHIYAEDREDLGYAFGWAQMHGHGDAILRLYGLARGRAAEYWGEEHVESDRFVRTLGIPEAGRAGYAEQSAEMRRYIDAFVDGMNAYARQNPDAIADGMERVLPVTGADVLAHGRRTMLSFLSVTGARDVPIGMDGMPRHPVPGSNTWAVGPDRSASGNAMLLQNPHLSWVYGMHRFLEAQLVAPGVDLYGSTLIGLPTIIIGFNDHLGWSHTLNTIDGLDTYRLERSGGGYRFDGEVRRFETERKTLRVRGADGSVREEPLLVRRSVHGPVIRMDDSTAAALRAVPFDVYGMFEQWWEMGRARSLEEFEAALRRHELPMLNVSYADRDGHILYLFAGRVPVRSSGDFAFWRQTVPGDTSATLWTEVHPYRDLPKVVDPTAGFVQNSNSPPWFATVPSPLDPADYPAYMAPQYMLLREQRGLTMLLSDEGITFDELVSMRYSDRMLLADRILDDLLPHARAAGSALAREAAGVLEAWDRAADADSRGAVLFTAWARRMCRAPSPVNRCGFAEPWSPDHPITTPDGLADPDRAVSALEEVAAEVKERFGALDVAWGRVNRLGRELPGSGTRGDPAGIFHVIVYQPGADGAPARPVHGDSYVGVVEFTPDGPRAEVLTSYGNASQPGSPHDGDQRTLVSREEMRSAWLTREEVEANLERVTPIDRTEAHITAEDDEDGSVR